MNCLTTKQPQKIVTAYIIGNDPVQYSGGKELRKLIVYANDFEHIDQLDHHLL